MVIQVGYLGVGVNGTNITSDSALAYFLILISLYLCNYKQFPTLLSNKGIFVGGSFIAAFLKSKLPVPRVIGIPMTIDAVTPSIASTFPNAAASNK